VKVTTHLQLVLRSRKGRSIHPLPIHLRGIVSQPSTGTTLPVTVEAHGRKKPGILISWKQFIALMDMKAFMTVLLEMEIALRLTLFQYLAAG
jgi:hypothetical protein